MRRPLPGQGAVGGDLDDVQLVDGTELLLLGQGRTGHAGELGVEAEVVLEGGKFRAVIEQIKECHAKGQPVLVGTVSIEKNRWPGGGPRCSGGRTSGGR